MSVFDQVVTAPNSPISPVLTNEEAELLAQLRRAHYMSCSDPTDPTRFTTHGKSALVIEALAARLEVAIKASPQHHHLL